MTTEEKLILSSFTLGVVQGGLIGVYSNIQPSEREELSKILEFLNKQCDKLFYSETKE